MSETLSQGNFDLALNRSDHDMVFHESLYGTGRIAIWPINGADKVAQQVKINLLSFLGEWFLNSNYGVPYLEEILVKNPRMPSVETILRSHINSVQHITRLVSFGMEWDRRTRVLSVAFEATTDYGPIKETVKLESPRANV